MESKRFVVRDSIGRKTFTELTGFVPAAQPDASARGSDAAHRYLRACSFAWIVRRNSRMPRMGHAADCSKPREMGRRKKTAPEGAVFSTPTARECLTEILSGAPGHQAI